MIIFIKVIGKSQEFLGLNSGGDSISISKKKVGNIRRTGIYGYGATKKKGK